VGVPDDAVTSRTAFMPSRSGRAPRSVDCARPLCIEAIRKRGYRLTAPVQYGTFNEIDPAIAPAGRRAVFVTRHVRDRRGSASARWCCSRARPFRPIMISGAR
jgi:hypothetical protein